MHKLDVTAMSRIGYYRGTVKGGYTAAGGQWRRACGICQGGAGVQALGLTPVTRDTCRLWQAWTLADSMDSPERPDGTEFPIPGRSHAIWRVFGECERPSSRGVDKIRSRYRSGAILSNRRDPTQMRSRHSAPIQSSPCHGLSRRLPLVPPH